MKNNSQSLTKQSRNYYMDMLKIFAIFAVVMIHASAGAVEHATVFDCPDFFFANVFNAASRFSVPVFVMVSGALMLDEKKAIDTKNIFSKYVKNIALMLVFWSAFFTVIIKWIIPSSKGTTVETQDVILYFIQGHYHLWYLYMLIGLYIATPVLRQFVQKDKKDTVFYFLKVGFIVQGIIPFILQLLSVYGEIKLQETYDEFNFYTFLGYSFYYVLGWYLHNFEFDAKKRRTLYILGAASVIFSIVFTYYASVDKNDEFMLTYRNLLFNNVLYSSAIFVFIKERFSKCRIKEKTGKIISTLSSLTFGVFIIHPLFVENFRDKLPENMDELARIPLFWLEITAVTFALCFLVSKIPGLKKLIRS